MRDPFRPSRVVNAYETVGWESVRRGWRKEKDQPAPRIKRETGEGGEEHIEKQLESIEGEEGEGGEVGALRRG